MSSGPENPTTNAESLFAQWLAARDLKDAAPFDDLCRKHRTHEQALRDLHAQWQRVSELQRRAGLGGSVSEQLVEVYGESIEPHVSLHAKEDGGVTPITDAVIARLSGRTGVSGRYEIRGEIARGGMGAILRVWDEDLRRNLAMKVILGQGEAASPGTSPDARPDASSGASPGATPPEDSKKLARFLEEAQVTGQLDHPGIVPVHELGLDANGRVYFTMRLVKGQTLKDVFDLLHDEKEDWSRTRALGVLLKVCEAMAYAHDKGVIHRDIKPGNIMVGKYGEVYVMDWGLARVLSEEDKKDVRIKPEAPRTTSSLISNRAAGRGDTPESPLYTMDGDIVGTPAYMSPEQASGDLARMGPHSDVYAVGAMLYHLLAGHMPYVPRSARMNNYAVWAAVQNSAPPPIHSLAHDAPAELIAICEKAMAREIKNRYRDMSELSHDLGAFLEGRVVAAYRTGAWAETKKWVERNKPLAASLAAAVVLLIGGLLTSLTLKARADANAVEANRLKDEAVARDRESRVRGLIQDVALFATLDDDLDYARRQPRPAHEWWLERAHELVDGVEEDTTRGRPWSPGLRDVEAALAKLRARAIERTPDEIEHDRATHPRAKELKGKRARLLWMSRMLGMEPWPSESEVEAELAKQQLPPLAEELSQLAMKQTFQSGGEEIKALLLARRAVSAAESEARAVAEPTTARERVAIQVSVAGAAAAKDDTSARSKPPAAKGPAQDAVDAKLKGRSWSAMQAIGPPDADFNAGDSRAWAYATPKSGMQWLELGYEPALRCERVNIYEVNAAGGIVMVQATDAAGALHTLWQGQKLTARLGNVFQIEVKATEYAVTRLRITLDTERSDTWLQIDAVQISGPDGEDWASSATASSSYGEGSHPNGEASAVLMPDPNLLDQLRYRVLDSLAWALLDAGRLDDALEKEREAAAAVRTWKNADVLERSASLEREVSSWRDAGRASRRSEHDAIAASITVIGREMDERRTWHFAESQDELWHAQLVQLLSDLSDLRGKLAQAERSVRTPEARKLWNEAIEAIAASPKYDGLRITPQLELVPIGLDPASGLWEFAHLGTGEPAVRGADGKIVLKPEMGMVFVLLPPGKVPVEDKAKPTPLNEVKLDAFFLSKYEMTIAQWNRVSRWSGRFGDGGDKRLFPADHVSWDDCVATLQRAGVFLRLPTNAQWEYGCRAGTTTPWWTGASEESLRGAANIGFRNKDNSYVGVEVQSVGQLRSNPFGLHDVHGNVWEWCHDDVPYDENMPVRPGDGERVVTDSRNRVYRGGGPNSSSAASSALDARSAHHTFSNHEVRSAGLRVARGVTP